MYCKSGARPPKPTKLRTNYLRIDRSGLRFEDDNRWDLLVPLRHVLEGVYYTHGNVCGCMCGRMRRANESQLNCVCVICGVCNYCSFSGSVQYGLAVSGQLGDVRFQAEQRPDDGHTASLLAPHV